MTDTSKQLLDQYWRTIEKDQDYAALAGFYADDAVLIDPVYGPFKGIDRIAEFLLNVTDAMRQLHVTFSVVETAAICDVGWSRWLVHLQDGTCKDGVSVYRFRGNKIHYQHDFIGSKELV